MRSGDRLTCRPMPRLTAVSAILRCLNAAAGGLSKAGWSSMRLQQQQQQQQRKSQALTSSGHYSRSKQYTDSPFTHQSRFHDARISRHTSPPLPLHSVPDKDPLADSCATAAAEAADDAGDAGGVVGRSKSWWPGWWRGSHQPHPVHRSSSSFDNHGQHSSSGGLSLHHNSSGLMVDPERGTGGQVSLGESSKRRWVRWCKQPPQILACSSSTRSG
jgi:hypothetical protein